MELSYNSKKLEKQLTNPKQLMRAFGQLARKVNQRVKELMDADNLSVMRTLRAARCHELKGKRKGEIAVDISGNYRLIFEPKNVPKPLKADGSLSWGNVTEIQINEIIDYH